MRLRKYLLRSSLLGSKTSISLLSNGKSETLALGEGDPGLSALTNDENVRKTGKEGVVELVLDVDNVETTLVALKVSDNTNTTQVTATGDHNNITGTKLDVGNDLTSGKFDLDGVVSLDNGVRVTNSATIVCNKERNTLLTKLDLLDLGKLVRSLLLRDLVDGKTTLNVVDETEVLTSLLKGDNVHETSGVGGVSSDLTINLNESLHDNGLDFTTVKSIFQTVSKEDNERKRLSKLVGTGGRSGSIGTGELVKHPVGWSCETLQVLLSVKNMLVFH